MAVSTCMSLQKDERKTAVFSFFPIRQTKPEHTEQRSFR